MKITLFTSNQPRHISLINNLSKVCDELYVIQECQTVNTGLTQGQYNKSDIIYKYFQKVSISQNKFFRNFYIDFNNKNIFLYSIKFNDLNKLNLKKIKIFLESDLYIVYGSSFIKDELIEFLQSKRAINIHMGISPYYKGTDCNFWAIYDENINYVGATIHLLSKNLDSGDILYHAISKYDEDVFDYSMSTVYSAFQSLEEKIKSKEIFNLIPVRQNRKKLIRYSTKDQFTDDVINDFFIKIKNLKKETINYNDLINPYLLDLK